MTQPESIEAECDRYYLISDIRSYTRNISCTFNGNHRCKITATKKEENNSVTVTKNAPSQCLEALHSVGIIMVVFSVLCHHIIYNIQSYRTFTRNCLILLPVQETVLHVAGQKITYNLVGIVVHHALLQNCGHYVSYFRSHTNSL